ncbi:hypothetical protein WMF31_36670 [Sorangium sp. So ce1036]|uniref:hypothetical protein n=1 Tax=Sorangium sp. So ce1036 TaxID=3133328 RepID=UPI003F102C45
MTQRLLKQILQKGSNKITSIKDGALYCKVLDAFRDISKKQGVPVKFLPPKTPIVRWTEPHFALTRSQIVQLSKHNKFSDSNRWSGVFPHDDTDGVAGSYWGETQAVSAERIHYAIWKKAAEIKGYGTLPVLTKNGHIVLEPVAFQQGIVLLCEINRPVKMVDTKSLIERLSDYPTLKSLGVKGLESAVLHRDDHSGARAISVGIMLANRDLWSKQDRIEELYQGLVVRSARIQPGEQGNNVVFLELPGIETMLPLEPKALISVRNTDTDGKVHSRYVPLDATGDNQQEIVERVVKDQEAFWTG